MLLLAYPINLGWCDLGPGLGCTAIEGNPGTVHLIVCLETRYVVKDRVFTPYAPLVLTFRV